MGGFQFGQQRNVMGGFTLDGNAIHSLIVNTAQWQPCVVRVVSYLDSAANLWVVSPWTNMQTTFNSLICLS